MRGVKRAVAALLLVVVAGCGPATSAAPTPAIATASPSDTPTPHPQAAVAVPVESSTPLPTSSPSPVATIRLKLDANWTSADRSADGFAIGLPPRWRDIDVDPQLIDESLQSITDPQYQALLRQQTASLSGTGVKLFAFDFTPSNVSSTGFTTNFNVVSETLPYAVSLDTYEQLTLGQLGQLDAVSKPIAHQRVTLPAGACSKLSYNISFTTGTTRTTSSITQYLLINGLTAYVITFTTTTQQLATYAPMFTKIATTFTLAK
jgi:hypothetical protein